MNITKNMASHKLISLTILSFVFLISLSCSEKSDAIDPHKINRGYKVEGEISNIPIVIKDLGDGIGLYLAFNEKDRSNYQKYYFNDYGILKVKRGTNFFAEEEAYFFDVNNCLSEFRKSIRLENGKKSLQEFIRYKNGIVDRSKSHYFDFSIIDSTEQYYEIELAYLGAFEVDEIFVLENNFEYLLEEVDTTKVVESSKGSSIIFTVKKNTIYDDKLGIYQINAKLYYKDDGDLVHAINKSKQETMKDQTIILRRLRKDMNYGNL